MNYDDPKIIIVFLTWQRFHIFRILLKNESLGQRVLHKKLSKSYLLASKMKTS